MSIVDDIEACELPLSTESRIWDGCWLYVVFVTDSGEKYRVFVRGVKEIIDIGSTVNESSTVRIVVLAAIHVPHSALQGPPMAILMALPARPSCEGRIQCGYRQLGDPILKHHPETR